MPRIDADRFALYGATDLPALREFVSGRGAHIDVLPSGSRGAFRVALHQNTPKLGGNRVTARPGDTLAFHGDLLVLEHRASTTRKAGQAASGGALFATGPGAGADL